MRAMGTGAAEKAVPRQNGFITRTHLRGTAYGSPHEGRAPPARRPFVAGFLEAFSHPRRLEASPPDPPPPGRAPLVASAVGLSPAVCHLGLWRLLAGAVRDRQGVRGRQPAQAPPARADRARLPEGPGAAAAAGAPRRGRLRAPAAAGGA